ncbi:MAG: hypothetical protein WC942_10325 [Clostridia bacterium]|jgi:hypothetical protein
MKDISFEITESGGIKFSRSNIKINEELKDLLLCVIDDVNIREKIIKFFEEYKETKVLFGEESLCG